MKIDLTFELFYLKFFQIIKDVIVRHHLLNGRKVHFKQGWDCHGLPIELKAISDEKNKLSPLEIRQTGTDQWMNFLFHR